MSDTLSETLTQSWWVYLVSGLFAALFGIAALVWPGMTLAVLILWFGIFVLIQGIFAIVEAFGAAGRHERWGWQLTGGIVGVLAGLYIIFRPGVTTQVVLILIGAWAIVTGIIGVVGAIVEHDEIPHAWLAVVAGVVAVIFGLLVFSFPHVSLVVLLWFIGIYAIVSGIVLIATALQVRSVQQSSAYQSAPLA